MPPLERHVPAAVQDQVGLPADQPGGVEPQGQVLTVLSPPAAHRLVGGFVVPPIFHGDFWGNTCLNGAIFNSSSTSPAT